MTKETCPECHGVNGHRNPFCSLLDLKAILTEPEEAAWMPAIQIVETAKDVYEALQILDALRIQVDHVASRVLHPCPAKPEWRVQAIMETNGDSMQDWLPNGMKHVIWRGCF